MDHAFQHDLGTGRHLQVAAQALHQFGLAAAQQSGELVFGKTVRHRRDRAEYGGRIGADHHRDRERLAGMRLAPVLKIQRAAAMRQPAHDDLVRRDHLLAVDAEILARLVRPARDHQAPGDQRRDIAGPAGLDRQLAQIHVACLPTRFPGRARWTGPWATWSAPASAPAISPRHPSSPWAVRVPSGRPAACPPRAAPRWIPRPCPVPRGAACRTGWPAPACCVRRVLEQDRRPCARSTRSQISVISRCGETGAVTRLSSPSFSSCAMKSRRSWYFI